MNRKSRILEAIDQHKYLRRWMIEQAFFRIPSGKRRSQILLKKMVEEKLLNRFRLGPREEYIYYQGKRSEKWRHWLLLNGFHFSLLSELKSWQKVLFYKHEYKYSCGIADGLYVVRTTMDSGIKFFLEIDDGQNEFDKVSRYESYMMSKKWEQEPWADPLKKGTKSFPLLVVATQREIPQGSIKVVRLERQERYKDLLRSIHHGMVNELTQRG